ncbi:hypothetical protein KL933_002212 [Ogataea haglerorum]|uniref:Restriction of telomere capping protein 4 n=1 Tax=Ogataea haglerorum TaxID=1937702 RepID=A0AAN6D7K7_9ASCO|nr:uncharacterized protein KL911_002842 [Ogataea haglerorum]KAG7704601.1 hypothetical protein KL914_003992 [Ogataea haglerorum]KAG7704958.1 hypothetical protein KL950_004131 [Ogataea haglerorum]KAG7719056.1 hypothetical protein KL913_002054 [Ogataea haglerorum]KAG7720119.1 hypothetical protein KL949_002084 [Ogataea haglerorum]KAG7728086.1 hypothetical protein KL933_002212 [Ogataea haglerorum]
MESSKTKFGSLTYIRKPRKLSSRIPSEDTLLGPSSSDSAKPRRKSKRDVYIACGEVPPSKRPHTNSADELLKDFDISRIKQDTDKLLNQLDSIKKPEKAESKYINKLLSKADSVETDEVLPIAETQGPMKHIYDDAEATERTSKKYSSFRPKIYTKSELLEATEKQLAVARDILNGKTASYFYEIAREYAESSPRLFVTDSEIINLPKQRYHGYIGSMRANAITQHLLSQLDDLLTDKKSNKVLQFWGRSYFTRFVLTPEIIARIVKQDEQVDLDKAYDMMESTADYGLYIMDQKEI